MVKSLLYIYRIFPSKDHLKFSVLFLMMLLASFLEVLGIGIIPIFIVAVAEPNQVLQYPVIGEWLVTAGITSSESLVVYGALLLIAIYILKNSYIAFFYYIKKRFVANRGVILQDRLFKAYMTAPYTFYISRNSAELLRNVTTEVKRIIEKTLLPFLELILNVVMFVFILTTLIVLEPLISLVTIILLGGGGYLFLRYTQKKTTDFGRIDKDQRKLMNKAVLQGLGGFKDARVLGRESIFLDQYRRSAIRSKVANVYLYVVKKLPKPIIETLAVISILLIALILVWEGRSITAIIPVLALFGAAAVRLMPVFNQVITQISDIRYNAHSVYAVYEDLKLLDSLEADVQLAKIKEVDKLLLENRIQVSKVFYRYPNSEEFAVNGVSLDIRKGDAVAFVGTSGAGKTTLADIILGLLVPESGSIKIDDVNILDNLPGWRQNIGYIPQYIYLLDDTIRRNVAFGIPDSEIDEEKLRNAIKAAQLEELIARMPKKDYTVIGERGIRISGGQRQRIGIARALYDDPQVLIMDEATSALDNVTEKFVIQAIEQLRGDRTIIMIAHRLTTVRGCDLIHVMKDGRIVESGTYDQLLTESEEFRKMSLVDG